MAGSHLFDRTALAVSVDERAHIDDPLTLLARDTRPVVRIRGVRKVFVLAEFLADGGDEVDGVVDQHPGGVPGLVALDAAAAHSLTSIAFPAISAGVYGYPAEEATAVIAAAVKDWLATNDSELAEVRLVGFSIDIANLFAAALNADD